MSILNQRVKEVKKALLTGQADDDTTAPDFQVLLEEERAGRNRKTLIAWLEDQDAQSSSPSVEGSVDASAPEVEPVYVEPETDVKPVVEEAPVAGIDSIEGGVIPINELISVLCQKRDRWQRSMSCGVENIKVHLSDIQISVS